MAEKEYIERAKAIESIKAERKEAPQDSEDIGYNDGILSCEMAVSVVPAADVVSWDWLFGYVANSWSRKDDTDFLTGAREAYKEACNG